MKLRHMPAAFAHSPLFLLRNAPKLFAHTFRHTFRVPMLGTFSICLARTQACVALAIALAVGGCAPTAEVVRPADTKPTAPPIPANVEPPPPAVNLSGFPLPYRQGYADGCASAKGAERKRIRGGRPPG